tara:strand:- start:1386 stop:2090 length:705 start_codon:yes stop_codon:yes gene_type:complete
MPLNPNVADMVSRITRFGTAPTNRYAIDFSNTPSGNRIIQSTYLTKRLSSSLETISVPGVGIASNPQRFSSGPEREMPYGRTYEQSIDMTFLVGADYFERQFFTDWMTKIQNHGTNTFGYYKDYVCDMTISLFDRKDRVRYSCKLYESWPKSVQSFEVGAETEGLVKQTVTMAYRWWEQVEPFSGRPINPQTQGSAGGPNTRLGLDLPAVAKKTGAPESIALGGRVVEGNRITE